MIVPSCKDSAGLSCVFARVRILMFRPAVFAKTQLLQVLGKRLGEKIMKKTLAAVAVLGAFAGSALAADVQL